MKQQSLKNRRKRPRNRLVRMLYSIQRLNGRGKALIFGGTAIAIAAIIVAIVLGSAAKADQVGMASMDALAPISDTMIDNTTAKTTDTLPTETPLPTASPTPTPDPTLQEGDENERVQELQNRLMDLGYLDLDESTMYYGPATKNAVSLFQRQHDLQQDGIAGEQTLSMINSDDAKPYTLLEGTKGDDVDALQRQLERLGYLDKATGYYGTETIEAVKKFQEQNDLEVDGKTGEHTLDVIYSPNAKSSPELAQSARRSANIVEMIEVAKAQLGKPYVWGAEGPKSFDCSGFVYYCLREAGSNRGRYNAKGYSEVEEWDKIDDVDDLEIGDLLFFWSSSRHKIGHVGIYIGDGQMIDASYSHNRIGIRDFNWSSYRFARRPW